MPAGAGVLPAGAGVLPGGTTGAPVGTPKCSSTQPRQLGAREQEAAEGAAF